MRAFALMVGLLVATAIFVVASPSAQAAENTKDNSSKKVVVIKSGDSLSKIARKHKTTYQRLFYANKSIKDPDVIHPGDKIRIPKKNEKLKKREVPANVVAKPVARTQQPTAQVAARDSARTTPEPVAPTTTAPAVADGSVWDRLAACESGGNWSINTGNGYYGGLQFKLSTWQSVGGTGYPHQHSRAEQIKRGKILQARSGWGQWPACTAKLGLR